ncbi:BZ3500_MvSof-1268-A1-R1_Chr8-2g10207 [Microbotryum saponariae]|uniref:BZ3500_MvSof-1268-A1-R1_Chr8-2g10207 protein n=1 Tax=Microbotryum saponariae TaxID=289078 RepID=A0A2X0LZB7_9BASI|nr:BZ3500_MvSof-1268-A1-R1_Chr8-2g10207 [Microbotryum saponariae]SDA02005.1 BZ3501_MvSof-1269-A2-R1_Chr8-2g09957 [Microbotryum saponariae]
MLQLFVAWKASIGLGAVVTLVGVLTPFQATSSSMRVVAAASSGSGTGKANTFEIVGLTGVSAQQLFLGTEKRVYVVDKTENNTAQIQGRPVWATEYRLENNTYRSMKVVTNSFCAGGNVLGNGLWLNVGGNQAVDKKGKSTGTKEGSYHEEAGGRTVRLLKPTDDGTAEWIEDDYGMPINRWYPYVETLGNGTAMIIGGELWGGFVDAKKEKQNVSSMSVFTRRDRIISDVKLTPKTSSWLRWDRSEFWPSVGAPKFSPFLAGSGPANLYPLVYLLPDGQVFMQADWKAQILDLVTWQESPLDNVPHAQRTYPASAATTVLPLTPANNYTVTLLMCGGMNPKRDDWDVTKWKIADTPTSKSCVSITPKDGAKWVEEDDLPDNRGMGNFIILPTGKLLLLNGVGRGSAGYGSLPWAIGQSFAQDPVLRPVIYDPSAPKGSRFTVEGLPTSTIPRMYHSSATLLSEGSVLVAGSNPNGDVTTEENNPTVPFKTEYRAEKFYPSWYDMVRPEPSAIPSSLSYGGELFQFNLPASTFTDAAGPDSIRVALIRTGFSTHAMNMGMKYIELRSTYTVHDDNSVTVNLAQLPANPNLFQPGPALFFVVVKEVPSIGRLVMVGNGKLGQQPVAKDTVLPASSGKITLTNSGAGSGPSPNVSARPGSNTSSHALIGVVGQVGSSLSLVESVGSANDSSSMPGMDMSNNNGSMSSMNTPSSSASKNTLATLSVQGLIIGLAAWLLA